MEGLKRGNIVAVKTKKPINDNNWFTGEITKYSPPNSKYNKSDSWRDSDLHIDLFLPVLPQWSSQDDETRVYYSNIEEIILLK